MCSYLNIFYSRLCYYAASDVSKIRVQNRNEQPVIRGESDVKSDRILFYLTMTNMLDLRPEIITPHMDENDIFWMMIHREKCGLNILTVLTIKEKPEKNLNQEVDLTENQTQDHCMRGNVLDHNSEQEHWQ